MPSTEMNTRNIAYFPMQSAQIGTDESGDPIYDNAADAELLRNLRQLEIKDGVYTDNSTYLQVMSNGDMTVTVKAGYAHIRGLQVWVKEDTVLTVETADALVNRTDRVVLRLSYADREVTLAIKKSDTTLTRSAGQTWELGLADLAVVMNNAVISQAEITDLRLDTTACGVVSGLMQVDTETIFNQYSAWWETQQVTTGYLTVAGENTSLKTTDKTVLGAINELVPRIIKKYNAAAQTLTNEYWTPLIYPTDLITVNNDFVTYSDGTFTFLKSGVYRITVTIGYIANGSARLKYLRIMKNGQNGTVIAKQAADSNLTAAGTWGQELSCIVSVEINETVYASSYVSGGAIATSAEHQVNSLTIEKIA